MRAYLIAVAIIILSVGIWFTFSSNDADSSQEYEQAAGHNAEEILEDNGTVSEKEAHSYNDKFIVSNPLDLLQIDSISKFRSCAGHDTPGYNADGEREYNRSMKHYLNPTSDARSDGIRIFSPFDGEVYAIMFEEQRGSQIYLKSNDSGEWYFVIYHADPAPGISKGSKITAGQVVAHANVGEESDFDIGVETLGGLESYMNLFESGAEDIPEGLTHLPKRDSVFYHMDDKVFQEYSSKGIDLNNIIISEGYRDQNPCTCADEECYFDTPHGDPSNWVVLR